MDDSQLLEGVSEAPIFTNDQIREIEEGKAEGLDVSVYAKPYFLAVHMRSIRLGMEEGLDVSRYAKKEYDWFQMEEIRIGMTQGIDVGIYADPKIDYSKMRIIREGLLEGIYLKDYVKYPGGVMRQVFLAKKSNVDLAPFIAQGYREAELESIRNALEQGLDVTPYITPDFNGESIKEVARGLEHGLDVTRYAFAEYNWEQMRELRKGLESRVDIALYRSHYYHAEQMREIREGMEAGLDVTPYANLMFTAKDMRRLRKKIEEDFAAQQLTTGAEENLRFDEYAITISKDEMTATLTLFTKQHPLDEDRLRRSMRSAGIVYGVDEEMIERLVLGKFAGTDAVIARGQAPVNGADGYYEYFFDLKPDTKPKIREDGSVDHMDLRDYCMVKKGDHIAYYHSAEYGRGGSTVTGKFLTAKNGKEKGILVGKGFIVDEDQKTYIALLNGRIELKGGKITITNVLELKTVSRITGNVIYDGDLRVHGDVEQGSVIKVTGDVFVDGVVEGATIESGKSITVRQVISQGGVGLVKAAEKVQAKFLESANIEAGDDVVAGYSINSMIYTKKRIILNARGGTLSGGTAVAEEGIDVENVGNKMGVATKIEIGSSERLKKQRQDLENEVREINRELQILYNANNEMMAKYPPEVRAGNDIFVKVENAIYTKELEMREKEDARQKMMEREAAIREAKAVIHGRIYDNVKLSISGVYLGGADTVKSVYYRGIQAKLEGHRILTEELN